MESERERVRLRKIERERKREGKEVEKASKRESVRNGEGRV
jgi:hypothetical protein